MDNNERNSSNNSGNERMEGQDNVGNQQNNWNNESMNTASGLRDELQSQQDSSGSGRSCDYGAEGSTEEDLNQDLGRNSNQQSVSNPISTPGSSNDNMPGHSDSRAGMGSGMTTKQGITGSDFDGQTRSS